MDDFGAQLRKLWSYPGTSPAELDALRSGILALTTNMPPTVTKAAMELDEYRQRARAFGVPDGELERMTFQEVCDRLNELACGIPLGTVDGELPMCCQKPKGHGDHVHVGTVTWVE